MSYLTSAKVAGSKVFASFLFLACGCLYLAGQTVPTAPNTATDPSSAIRKVLSDQQGAWNRGDISAFLEGYLNSPELTFASSDGIVRGHDGLLERYLKNYPDQAHMGELEFSNLEIQELGDDWALVVGHWHLRRSLGDAGGVGCGDGAGDAIPRTLIACTMPLDVVRGLIEAGNPFFVGLSNATLLARVSGSSDPAATLTTRPMPASTQKIVRQPNHSRM